MVEKHRASYLLFWPVIIGMVVLAAWLYWKTAIP